MFNAERHPDKVALADDVRSLSFGELCQRARGLAAYLSSLGVGRGDRIALLLDNSIDYLALLHASAVSGFCVVPVNTRYNVSELLFLLEDCAPKVVLYEPQYAAMATQAQARLAPGHPMQWLDSLPDDLPDTQIMGPAQWRSGSVDDNDVALIMYTSGTTSSPKGAMLTHGNLAWNAINYMMELGINEGCKSLLATPLFHIGGFGVINGPILYAGGSLHILPRFDTATVIEALITTNPTHVFLLSAMWVGLTDNPDFAKLRLPLVSYVQTAAAPLGEWRQKLIQQVFPNAEFGWGFGMTETCVTTIKNRYTHEIEQRPGSIGYFWRHISYKLVGEDGQELEDKLAPGELHIKGPTVFKGYWQQPELTAQVLSQDGWLCTGDIIRLDKDGFAYFMGRSKDMVKTGGENVAAIEVENCLASHPDIREAAVFGLPHEYWGEELVAAVVAATGKHPDADTLRAYCRQHLSGFKVPKRIFIVSSLPQSSSGKVQKFRLKQDYLAL